MSKTYTPPEKLAFLQQMHDNMEGRRVSHGIPVRPDWTNKSMVAEILEDLEAAYKEEEVTA